MSAGLAAALDSAARSVEEELERLLETSASASPALNAAMRHAVLGGGKRIRAFLAIETTGMSGGEPAAGRRIGAAIELLHAYSLVHDDLPAMDDATLRRGRPACHRVFGEATAILAGDALQALAFEVLAREDWPATASIRVRLLRELAEAAGAKGMCGGQMLDLEGCRGRPGEAAILELQALKTGALIRFAARSGAIAGAASERVVEALDHYAARLGLAFQISDDLLDLRGDRETTGKDVGKDAEAGKATLVGLLGEAEAHRRLLCLREEAEHALQSVAGDITLLRELFEFVINRKV